MEVVKGRGYVYSIQYHIVWCVKYRRDVLNGQVAIKLKELLTQISKDNGFQILEMNMDERSYPYADQLYAAALHSKYYKSYEGCIGQTLDERVWG